MKKNFYIFISILFISLGAKSQNLQWATLLTGNSTVPSDIYVTDVITRDNGDVYICGFFSGQVDFDPTSGLNIKTAINNDGFVARYDAGKNLTWVYATAGPTNEAIRSLNYSNKTTEQINFAVDKDDVSFYMQSLSVSTGATLENSPTYSVSGGNLNIQSINKSNGAFNYDVFVVLGSFTGNLSIEGRLLISAGGYDTFYAVFQQGTTNRFDFVNSRSLGSTGNDFGYAAEIRNDNFVLAGSFEGTVDFDPNNSVTQSLTSNGLSDGFIVEYPILNSGNLRFYNQVGGTGVDAIRSLSIPSNDVVYLGGTFAAVTDFDFSASSINLTPSAKDGFIVKYNVSTPSSTPVYTFAWADKFGGSFDDDIVDIYAYSTSSDVYFAAGIGNTQGGYAPFLGSYSQTGVRNNAFGGLLVPTNNSGFAYSSAIASNSLGNIFMGGSFSSTNLDVDPSASTTLLTGGANTFNNSFLLKFANCTSAITPTISQVTNGDGSVTLTVNGILNGNSTWTWYRGSCGGTLAGTGNSITISVNGGGTYFVRGEGGCAANGSCSAGENVNVTLPVNLIDFTATNQNNGVLINWKTTSEINNDYFEISHSTDGKTFTSLATIKPKSENLAIKDYSVIDKNPIKGVNYYQLLQFDKDGKRNDLGIKFVNFNIDENMQVSVYPNPAVKDVRVVYPSNVYQSIKIVNLSGTIIISQNIKTGQYISDLSISDFKPGTYLIIISGTNSIETRKLIVK